jgi:hypothetical protein
MEDITKTAKNAKSILWFLRHGVEPRYISEAGWVHIGTVSWFRRISRADIRSAVATDPGARIEIAGDLIRATEAHSIGKVREDRMFQPYTPSEGERAYKLLRVEHRCKWRPGDDMVPLANRNSCFMDPQLRALTEEHYGSVEIDVYGLHLSGVPIWRTPKDSLVVRGNIPARYIRFTGK